MEVFCARHPKELRSQLHARCHDLLFLHRLLPGAEIESGEVAALPEQLGDFRLLRELGSGGMGVVYLARQVSLDREVAVKVLMPHLTRTERQVERFQREARAAARLHHPGIAPIHAVGREGDTHYFAMDFIAGHSLDRELSLQQDLTDGDPGDRLLLPPHDSHDYIAAVAGLCAQVADALEYGHEEGIVHRDVKPGNILLDRSGWAHIVDFGLAKDLSLESISLPGELAGTPHYMSPEQTLAKRVPVDRRTDVFSLGVVLYELLTLERPFEGATSNEILYQISFRDPQPIRRINPRAPRDLATICGKALQKSPDVRYASAGELADDLRRFLHHEAIQARPPTLRDRARRFVVAHRAGVAAVVFTAVALSIGFAWAGREARAYRTLQSEFLAETDLPTITVFGAEGEVWSRLIDPASGKVGERRPLGTAPLREQHVKPGFYRIVVENKIGFCELTRYLELGDVETIEAIIRPTAEVVRSGVVQIPGGRLSPGHGGDDPEGMLPMEPFDLPAFWIDECEVSNREYVEFLEDTGHPWPESWTRATYRREWDDLPVVEVTWFDSVAYAEWAGKRLPSQGEWELAARGEEGRLYPWGDDPRLGQRLGNVERPLSRDWSNTAEAVALYLENAQPVRSHPEARTPEGLYHMLGNVSELTESMMQELVRGKVHTFPFRRALRGGAWDLTRGQRNLGTHGWIPAFYPQNNVGFRCAKSVNP